MNGKMGHHNKAFPAYRLPTRCRLVPSSLVAHHVCLLVHSTQMVGIARTEACEFASCEGGGKAPQLLFDRKEEQQQSDHSVTCRSCSISWNREGHGDSYRARKGSKETNENGNSVGLQGTLEQIGFALVGTNCTKSMNHQSWAACCD